MDFLLIFFIFIITVILYFHVVREFKKPQDLTVYEIDYTTNQKLQEVCNERQPIIFFLDEWKEYDLLPQGKTNHVEAVGGEGSNKESDEPTDDKEELYLSLKDIKDFTKKGQKTGGTFMIDVEMPLPSALSLLNMQSHPFYYTENNGYYLKESGLGNLIQRKSDKLLKPEWNAVQWMDVFSGSVGLGLPMYYHTWTRKFLYVHRGKIEIKLAMHDNTDLLKFKEGVSLIDCWNSDNLFRSSVIKTVEFTNVEVSRGFVFYIPAFMIYSIRYLEEHSCVIEFNYQSALNVVIHPNSIITSMKNTIETVFFHNEGDVQEKSEAGGEIVDEERATIEKDPHPLITTRNAPNNEKGE